MIDKSYGPFIRGQTVKLLTNCCTGDGMSSAHPLQIQELAIPFEHGRVGVERYGKFLEATNIPQLSMCLNLEKWHV